MLCKISSQRAAQDSAFGELSAKFSDCVELISEVAARGRKDDIDIISLYREWRASGDERLTRRLRALGVKLDESADSNGDLH